MQMKIDLMNPDDDLGDACIRKMDKLPKLSKWPCFQIFLQFLQIYVLLYVNLQEKNWTRNDSPPLSDIYLKEKSAIQSFQVGDPPPSPLDFFR